MKWLDSLADGGSRFKARAVITGDFATVRAIVDNAPLVTGV